MQDFTEQEILPLGAWTQEADAIQRWQWEIHSPGAQSHLLVFRSAVLDLSLLYTFTQRQMKGSELVLTFCYVPGSDL